MILALTLILLFQLAGVVVAQILGNWIPGPVIGMVLLLGAMLASPRLAQIVRPAGQGLLAHLSLLFVPAGVGVVGHLTTFGGQGAAIFIVLLVSTALALVAGALAFVALSKLGGRGDD